jgi:hypothetical protein
MASRFDVVDIWVGRFASGEALHAYLAERPEHYADDTDTLPISQFAQDQGEWFIDHDFQCTVFVEDATDDMTHLLQESLISSDFGLLDTGQAGEAFLAALYKTQHGQPANSIILVYGEEVQHPRSLEGADDQWLHYLGRFHEMPSN